MSSKIYASHEDKITIEKNVISVERYLNEPRWKIHSSADQTSEGYAFYFFMDSPGDDAFAHWVFESFIFYPFLVDILKEHPATKILTSNKKKYVRNMLLLFDIDIPIVHEVETTINTVFFPPVMAINHPSMEIFDIYFKKYIDNLKIDKTVSPIKLIYLPRNKCENFHYNDRAEPLMDSITELVLKNNGTVLDTYPLNNIKLQMEIVNSAEIIIVHYGSAYWVNCAHLKNKTIILLDSPIQIKHIRTMVFYNKFFKYIWANNTIMPVLDYTEELKGVLNSVLL
jgi:hypothetical protein